MVPETEHSDIWPDVGAVMRRIVHGRSGVAIQAGCNQLTWPDVTRRFRLMDAALTSAGIGPGQIVAVPGRNDLDCASMVLALLATDRGVAIINPFQSGAEMLKAARASSPAAIILPENDPALDEVESRDRVLVLTRAGLLMGHANKPDLAQAAVPGDRRLCMGTSGTTGTPKLIDITTRTLSRAIVEIAEINRGFGDRQHADGSWPALIQYSPLAHIGGALTLIRGAMQCRPVVMLDKFEASSWADIVETYRPSTTGLPPTMMRMVLDSGIPAERLTSLVSVWSGTAPARTEDCEAFSDRFGLPILGNYGATEFCGAIAAWSLGDHRAFFPERRRAVGRIDPRIAMARVRDAKGTLVADPEVVGTLEVKVHRIGNAWQPTSDLASLDRDGFLSLHGRVDDAIVRGGFKLMPDKIAAVLRSHPAVRDVAVIGIADDRLGQVPVGVVETHPDMAVDENELIAFVRERLPAYFVPVTVRAVGKLPRTSTLKLDRGAIRALFQS